jgi:EAL domain-containing protein (putative c-di-GMP-specific phosphodiesterase class I)
MAVWQGGWRFANLQVMAAGAEAAGQAKRLWKLGCDNAQGYFYAKPMAGLQVPGHFSALNDKGMKT